MRSILLLLLLLPPLLSSTPQRAEIVLCSWNRGKVEELREVGRVFGAKFLLPSDVGLGGRDETVGGVGGTLEERARGKAVRGAGRSGKACMGDCERLRVPALEGGGDHGNGEGTEGGWWERCARECEMGGGGMEERVNALLGGAGGKATLECGMGFALPDGRSVCAREEMIGKLVWPPRGSGGGLFYRSGM